MYNATMSESENGYSVIYESQTEQYGIIRGLSLPLRADDCGYVLQQFLKDFHNRVEPLGTTETFGYARRQIAGTNRWSNHASGTAVDANASQHPYGRSNTFTNAEESRLRDVLEDYDDVIRWGGDYNSTSDEMHFEIDKPYAAVRLVAIVHRRDNTVTLSRLVPGKSNYDVYFVKRALKKKGLWDGDMGKYFGKPLRRAYAKYQESLGYSGKSANGIPGRASLLALGLKVK